MIGCVNWHQVHRGKEQSAIHKEIDTLTINCISTVASAKHKHSQMI